MEEYKQKSSELQQNLESKEGLITAYQTKITELNTELNSNKAIQFSHRKSIEHTYLTMNGSNSSLDSNLLQI